MAIVKYGAIVTEMRGKMGGTVYSRNAYGGYSKNKASPVQPNSAAQQQAKSRMGNLAQQWRGLTQAQRDAWNSLAPQVPTTNRFGDPMALTGFNLFMQLNRNLSVIGEEFIEDAPPIVSVPVFTLTGLTATYVPATPNVLSLAFSPDPSPDGYSVAVFATPGVGAGKTYVKNLYRYLNKISTENTPVSMITSYEAVFGTFPPVGSKIFIKARCIDADYGWSGVTTVTSAIVTE